MSNTTTPRIDSQADRINSLDIIKRIKELQAIPKSELTDYQNDQLEELLQLQEDARGVDGWEDGISLVNSNYLADYAKEVAEEMHGYTLFDDWPIRHIDWDAAAEEWSEEMTEVDYGYNRYWVIPKNLEPSN